jgi:hypothetical protein
LNVAIVNIYLIRALLRWLKKGEHCSYQARTVWTLSFVWT